MRDKTLNDAPVLQEAHRAYRNNGGSMKALLKSDAFKTDRSENGRMMGAE